MYRNVMGPAFNRLDHSVQQFHSRSGWNEFDGWVEVHAPGSFLAKLMALCLGTPLSASSGAIRFELNAGPESESWTRFFPSKRMASTLTKTSDRVVERLGVARLTFELIEVAGALEMRLECLHFFGIRCPLWLMPQVVAMESGIGDSLNFQVRASLPLVGTVASYSGYLNMPSEDRP
jgi:hypothetical protein